jgi:trans-aconitate 2-methyltransferase
MSSFEFDGNKYRQASAHQKEWGNKIIFELFLTGDEEILDLGCGDGILTAHLAGLVPGGKVTGIDASRGMITTARELEKDNLVFQLMDINRIDFDNRFDLIFSNATLHWIKDHQTLLRNCYQALKPGGVLRFNFAGDGNCARFFTVVKSVISDEKYQKYFSTFDWPWYMPETGEYEKLVAASNFKEIKVWDENADRYFQTAAEMIKWIDQPSLVPFLKWVDENDQASFRDTVVEKMIQTTIQPDGTCFETFRRINVLAKK